ncbi:MAG: hypothetical protein K2N94_00405 [Lachnospiraceae bacterium]|nr:hypothetical protein [Lachnospiraceae bacterium]
MKKLSKLAAVLMSSALFLSAAGELPVRAEEVVGQKTEQKAAEYAKLSYDVTKPVELVSGEVTQFQVEKVNNKTCYFTFSLKETSRVEITGHVEGGSMTNLSWNFRGVYTDKLCTKGLSELDAVDAGTYYVVFECTPNRLSDDQVLTVSLETTSWGWGEGVDGKTTDNPIALTVGKDCKININEKYATRYTKFALENDTVLKVQGNIAESYSSASMRVYDAKGTNITSTAAGVSELELGKPGEWSKEHTLTLKAGTYYLGITWRGQMYSSDFTFRTEILKETDNTPPAKPTKLVYKAGTTKVTGNGEKNATVFVRVGDTIYSGKITSKGTFSIKTAKLVKGDVIYVWVMDKALNQGRYVKVTVK